MEGGQRKSGPGGKERRDKEKDRKGICRRKREGIIKDGERREKEKEGPKNRSLSRSKYGKEEDKYGKKENWEKKKERGNGIIWDRER